MRKLVFVFTLMIAALFAIGNSVAFAAGLDNQTASVINYVQGTGPTQTKTPSTLDGVPVTSLSKDLGWEAAIAPVSGDRTMDESRPDGVEKLDQLIDNELAGGAVVIDNLTYSLGSLVGADAINKRALDGKDNSRIRAQIDSDPAYTNTGILVVLEPLAPILGPTLGITPTGERVGGFGEATVALRCWTFDLICDLKNPVLDPWGAINSGVGYLTQHGGMDPIQNYSDVSEARTTTKVEGALTKVTFHGELPTIRVIEMITGDPVDPTIKRIANAAVLSKGDPGEQQEYKTAVEVFEEAANIQVPDVNLDVHAAIDTSIVATQQTFDDIVAPLNEWATNTMSDLATNAIAYTDQTAYQATPATYAPTYEETYTPVIQTAASDATSFIDDAASNGMISVDLGNQINAGITDLATQGLALLAGK